MENRKKREEKYSTWPALLLGSMMVLSGAIMTILRLVPLEVNGSTFYLEDTGWGLAGRILLMLGGLAIILFRKKGNYFTVGLYALSLGTSRVLRSIPDLFSEPSEIIILDAPFYLALVFLVVGGNLAYGGYNHLTSRTRDPRMMRYTALAIGSVYSLMVLYVLWVGEDVITFILGDIDMIGFVPLYVGLLMVLYSREIMENNPQGRISMFLTSASRSLYVGNRASMVPWDVKRIEEAFTDTSSWEEQTFGNITLRECVVTLYTDKGDKDLILQKWQGSDALYLSLINDRTDSFLGGSRMKVLSYLIDGDMLILRDSYGVCARIKIEWGGI